MVNWIKGLWEVKKTPETIETTYINIKCLKKIINTRLFNQILISKLNTCYSSDGTENWL